MAIYQWQLIHSFTLPLDSKGRQLWRVDFDANYHNDLAELRQKYSEYQQETRGDVHTQIDFWVLLPTPKPTPKANDISPIDFKKLQAKEGFKGDLDYLHGQIEEILRDDCLEAYPELNCALQNVSELIEKLDIKIDYYNC